MLNIGLQLLVGVITSGFRETFIFIHSFYPFYWLKIQNILSFQCLFFICKLTMEGNQSAWCRMVHQYTYCCKRIKWAQKSQSTTKISHQITPLQNTQCFFHCGCSAEGHWPNLTVPLTLSKLYSNVGSADSSLEPHGYIPGPFGTKLPHA